MAGLNMKIADLQNIWFSCSRMLFFVMTYWKKLHLLQPPDPRINFLLFHFSPHPMSDYRHHWLLPFYPTYTDLDLAWGSQGHRKSKTYWFHFSHTFPLIRMKFYVVMKQFMLNYVRLLLSKVYWDKGSNCCFTDCVKNVTLAHIPTFMNWFSSNLLW